MSKVPENLNALWMTRFKAWAVLVWEQFWPRALPSLGVLSVFLILSWLGVWPLLPDLMRMAVVLALAIAFVFCLKFFGDLRLPQRSQLNSLIEQSSGLKFRPLSARDDVQADIQQDQSSFADVLWREHQNRMGQGLDGLKSRLPNPKVAAKDPWALRGILGLFLFIALVAGRGNYLESITDAFRSHDDRGTQLAKNRIDVWVTPPAYTNKPPLFLSRGGQDEQTSNGDNLVLPEGSELIVRISGFEAPSLKILSQSGELDVKEQGKTDADASEDTQSLTNSQNASDQKPSNSATFKTKLNAAGSIVLLNGDEEIRDWDFAILPDDSPAMVFSEDPSQSANGQLELSYTLADDYGVTSAIAKIEPVAPPEKNARPLVPQAELKLYLPSRRVKEGKGKTSKDLSEHPLAGSKVIISVIAKDDAGQVSDGDVRVMKLPGRIFSNPLAKALVFERRRLALDARTQKGVAEMLDIITSTHPDLFIPDLSHYTSMRVAYRHIRRARSDDALREGLELLWQIALAVENGDLSLAQQRLREAQERLAEALERGASDEEISKLMDELRQAMKEFLTEMAEHARQNPQNQQAQQQNQNSQILRQQDLDQLMKQIEELSKSGSKDAARELLRQMQEMLDNLQMAQPQQNQQQNDPFSQQMNELSDMMRRQQELMDDTFSSQRRQQQQQNRQGQNGEQQRGENQRNDNQQGKQQNGQGDGPMTPEEFAEAMKQLQKQQGELKDRMEKMQQEMRELGLNPGESMNEAGEAMGQAQGNLQGGQPGEATNNQGRALQAMREGAQNMMQQMRQQAGEQGRRGERGQHGEQSRSDGDPLGRQGRSRGPQLGDETKGPSELNAQRAREILDAIRRRLGETTRPPLELDYLDRLLPSR